MGATAEMASLQKEVPSRSPETPGREAAVGTPGVLFDPLVERLLGGAPPKPPHSAGGSLSVQRLKAPVLQRAQRLYGNQAAQAMVMGSRVVQRQCACGGTCPKCNEEEHKIQRRSDAAAPAEFGGIPTSTGQPLDVASRRPLEAHFGADLADVRVHTGREAADSARSLDALAYTSGRDIYFAPGMYSPRSGSGQRLLAHEVAHVVQQGSGKEPAIATKSASGVKIGAPDDPLEADADRAAEEFMSGAHPDELTEKEHRKASESSGTIRRFLPRYPTSGSPTSASPQLVTRKKLLQGGATDVVRRQPKPPPTASDAPPVQDATNAGVALSAAALPPKKDAPAANGEQLPAGGGVFFSEDYDFDRHQMEQAILKKDIQEPNRLVNAFKGWHRITDPGDASQLKNRIFKVIQQIETDLKVQYETFTQGFETDALAVTRTMLDASEERLKAEKIRYGIKDGEMSKDGGAVTGMIAAAKILLDRRKDIETLRNEQATHVHPMRLLGLPVALFLSNANTFDAQYYELQKRIETQETLYELLRQKYVALYPVLGPYTQNRDDTGNLAQLATGPGAATAKSISDELDNKQKNIEKVRAGAKPDGKLNPWKLPQIVVRTQAAKGIRPGSLYDKYIQEKTHSVSFDEMLVNIALGVLNLALLVLGPATFGLSLVVAAGISTALAVSSVEEYMWDVALAGTDLDKAHAISAEDPSLVWVALDIVMAAVDIKAAGSALKGTFKLLGPQVKAVIAAKTAEESVTELQKLRALIKTGGAGVEVEKLTAKLLEDAEHFQKAGGTLERAAGASEEQVKALEAAAKAGEHLVEEGVLASAKGTVGEVKVTKSGALVVCSSPCMLIRERYAAALSRSEDLLRELEALEQRAAKLKGGDAAGIADEAKKLADESAGLQSRLHAIPTATRLEYLEWLKSIASKHPLLQRLGPDAIERILAKGTEINKLKGQLLEELVGVEARKMIDATIAAGKGKVVYIDGHRVTGNGRALTDGVLAIRDGNTITIVKVFETKAGSGAAEGLIKSAEYIKKMSESGKKELERQAIEALRNDNPALKSLSDAQVAAQYRGRMWQEMIRLNATEGGQLGRDVERLMEQEIRIDGEPVKVLNRPSTIEFIGGLPSDVSATAIEKSLAAEGFKFKAMGIDVTQKELIELAEDLAKATPPEGLM